MKSGNCTYGTSLVVALLVLAVATAAADWAGQDPVGGSLEEEVGVGGCCARGRGYTFLALGDGDFSVYPFEHASQSWVEDFDGMPEAIDNFGAMAYERLGNGRLFVASDEGSHLNVYFFRYPWGVDGHWLDQEVQAPIDLPEAIGPGVALAFQPVDNPRCFLSGNLYLLAGHGRHLWRRAFPQVPWAVDGLGPGDGDTVTLDSLDFDWRTDPRWTSYNLQLSTSPGFDFPAIDTVLSYGEFCPQSGGLAADSTYYWRVCGLDPDGTSQWSDIWSLRLTNTTCPRSCSQFPTDGLLTSGDEPSFDWPSAATAVSYRLQVSSTAGFADTVLDATVPVSEYTSDEPLQTGTWYWRTCWQNPIGQWSAWSASRPFETVYGWAPLPDIPSAARVDEGGAMCYVKQPGEALYVLVGNNSHEFWRFNLDADTWEQLASTTPSQTWGASITARAWSSTIKLYAIMGGEDDTLRMYKTSTNDWDRDDDGTPLPRACGAGSCLVMDEDYNLTLAIAGEYSLPPTNFYKRVETGGEDGGQMAPCLSARDPARVHLTRSAGQVGLHYVLRSSGPVQAVVFNAVGRKVRTLFSGEQTTGEHGLVWALTDRDGGHVGAGLYFVTLDFDGSRTMLKVPVW